MGNTGTDVCLAGSDHREISVLPGKMKCIRVVTADEYLKTFIRKTLSCREKSGNALFIF